MTVNDSSTGGPLAPQPPPLLEDDALDDFLTAYVAGIVGLPNSDVMPRWQPEPGNYPTGNWAAVGIVDQTPDTYAWVGHHCDNAVGGPGHDELQQHEDMHVLCSFYGPNAKGNASLLSRGLQIGQNREPLFLAGMGFVRAGPLLNVPVLMKQQYRKRVDLSVYLRRVIDQDYAVLNLKSAVGTISADNGAGEPLTTPFIATQE